MRKFFDWLDEIARVNCEHKLAMWLERIAFVFLILMILSAPHSIAATQTAWLLGTATWLVRFFIKPRPKFVRTPLDIALWVFFGWTAITSVFSYAPDISIGKLPGALLFLIFHFVVNNLRTIRAAKFLAFALIFSCMVGVIRSPIERLFGRGVEIYGISAESLFTKAVHFDHDTYLAARGKNFIIIDDSANLENDKLLPLVEGNAIIEANGRAIKNPDDLAVEIEKNEVTYLECYNSPEYFTRKVKRENLRSGTNSLEKLGISGWRRSRNWRYAGFYGQVITYAEVLLQIAALALGLFIAGLSKKTDETTAGESLVETKPLGSFSKFSKPFFFSSALLLFACLALMAFTLWTTFTRAAELAFLISAFAIVLANGSRKMLLTVTAIILPLALGGLFFMQQIRQVDFYDQKDASVNYRQTVYREGFNLWTNDARKFLLGIGMDSTKRFAKDWHLFDDGKLPPSHFHSTPLQLLVERGLPALLLWFWILWIYAQTLLRKLKFQISDSSFDISNQKSKIQNPESDDWQTTGIILGCFGGLVGFFVSSLVNYSLGDGEVAMVFFILMGIGVSLSIQNTNK